MAAFLGGEPETWSTREVGDGNINFVYIVQGAAEAIVVKQALPYVRCVGESWPLTPDRARLEAEALVEGARHCPGHVPKVWKYDDVMKTIWMRYIEPPHIILRKGLCQVRERSVDWPGPLRKELRVSSTLSEFTATPLLPLALSTSPWQTWGT